VNTGLSEARGDYVIRMDDDDLFTSDRLDIAQEGLARAPVGLCWARFIDEEPSAKRVLEGDVGKSILDNTTPHMGAVAVVRDLFPPLDEDYLGTEDVEWWLRVAQLAPVFTVPRFGYLIRRHSEPRIRHGLGARASGSRRLLEENAPYFRHHPKAAAFRWKRIGLMELELGNRSQARVAFIRSLRLRPQLGTAKHLIRAVRGT
jgi:glycosyltransferase involved in cell wall biosynthesis